MKTAEEWTSEIIDYELTHYDGSYTKLIKQIQLDAFKAGERFAAEICDMVTHQEATIDDAKQAILTDANNRTELP